MIQVCRTTRRTRKNLKSSQIHLILSTLHERIAIQAMLTLESIKCYLSTT
jgi:hypothetical protein